MLLSIKGLHIGPDLTSVFFRLPDICDSLGNLVFHSLHDPELILSHRAFLHIVFFGLILVVEDFPCGILENDLLLKRERVYLVHILKRRRDIVVLSRQLVKLHRRIPHLLNQRTQILAPLDIVAHPEEFLLIYYVFPIPFEFFLVALVKLHIKEVILLAPKKLGQYGLLEFHGHSYFLQHSRYSSLSSFVMLTIPS